MPQNEYQLSGNIHLPYLRIAIKRILRGESIALRFHTHDAIEIAIVLESGDAIHWAQGKAHTLQRGDILLLVPGVMHAYENCSELQLVNILYNTRQLPLPPLDGNMLKLFSNFTDPNVCSKHPEKPLLHLHEDEFSPVLRLIELLESELQSSNPGKNLCGFGIFIALLTKIIQAGGIIEQDEHFSSAARALNFLNLHFTENIDIDQLAKMCNLSRAGLFRHFKELTGYSPAEYQRLKRLDLAGHLLKSTNKSLGEIANECGFCDSNHLNRHFSRKYSVSPGKYRSQS